MKNRTNAKTEKKRGKGNKRKKKLRKTVKHVTHVKTKFKSYLSIVIIESVNKCFYSISELRNNKHTRQISGK